MYLDPSKLINRGHAPTTTAIQRFFGQTQDLLVFERGVRDKTSISMAVLLNTSVGDLVIDLFVEDCPKACENFLKLCAIKYYNDNLLYNVQQNYIMQAGDPTGTSLGGNSIYGILNGQSAVCFDDEISKKRKTNKVGYVGMAHNGGKAHTNRSQFFITLRGEDMEHIGQQHTIFGVVAEGYDVLEKINNLFCDEDGRPYQDVRILHTFVLDDPLPNPSGLIVPPSSPVREYPPEEKVKRRIPYEEAINGSILTKDGRTEEEIEESIRKKEAKSRAIVLEMIGDLPDAEVKPPDEVLFVCKLNPVTRDEDLELIFSQFGPVRSCEIIRDQKTGDSLNYAFIEFETETACIRAFEKMNNALIDERRIKVDFSQSVSKLWNRFLMRPRGLKAKPGDAKKAPSSSNQPPSIYGPNKGVAESKERSATPQRSVTVKSEHNESTRHRRERSRSRSPLTDNRSRRDDGNNDRYSNRRDSEKYSTHDSCSSRDDHGKRDDSSRYSRRDSRDRDRDRRRTSERSRSRSRDRRR